MHPPSDHQNASATSVASPVLVPDVHARGEVGVERHALAVQRMFDRISPTYDLLNRLLSLGIDRRWRTRALSVLGEGLPADIPISCRTNHVTSCGYVQLCG